MIVRDRPSPLRLFLVMRGSVLPNIWKSLLGTTLLAVAVTWTHGSCGATRSRSARSPSR
jgi:putative membrane protein